MISSAEAGVLSDTKSSGYKVVRHATGVRVMCLYVSISICVLQLHACDRVWGSRGRAVICEYCIPVICSDQINQSQ